MYSGFMQPQGHVQVLLNVLRGMTPQAALDAPRFCISAGLPSADSEDAEKSGKSAGEVNSEVYIEEGISDEVFDKLRGESRGRSMKERWLIRTPQRWAMTLVERKAFRELSQDEAR